MGIKLKDKIVIVGAGVGGLATAARLGKQGYNVEVYERLPHCGGRANIIEDRGFRFDTGPSFVLMPDFFREVFDYCERDLEDYLNLKKLDISYHIFFSNGKRMTIYEDKERTKEEIEKIEPGSSCSYEEFIAESGRIYSHVKNLLYACFTKKDAFRPTYWPLILKIKALKSYWQLARKYFHSEELAYAFTFESMFIGVSPFTAPAFYSVITYADHVQKIFHPMGGMYQIPRALERMAKEFGVKFFYDSEISRISKKNGKISLKLNNNEIEADRVVINADYAYARSSLLSENLPKYKYSCSVYLLYLGIKQKIKGLAHHNLFFTSDLRRNLNEIFDRKVFPQDPSFYIHVPTVTDQSLAPKGKDIIYILIPVPNLNGSQQDIGMYEESLKETVLDVLMKRLGIDTKDLIEVEHRFYPRDFISRYNIKYGATFGLSHTLSQSAFFRPANYDSKNRGVYFVGASTQPGGGLPPVIASSRIVADLITEN